MLQSDESFIQFTCAALKDLVNSGLADDLVREFFKNYPTEAYQLDSAVQDFLEEKVYKGVLLTKTC